MTYLNTPIKYPHSNKDFGVKERSVTNLNGNMTYLHLTDVFKTKIISAESSEENYKQTLQKPPHFHTIVALPIIYNQMVHRQSVEERLC